MTNEQTATMCLTLVALTLILASLTYCQNNDRLASEALKAGLDPQSVYCTFKANVNINAPACQNYVRK